MAYASRPANKSYATNYRKPQAFKKPSRLGKRWYVDAQIPKAMPFIGGASFRAGSGSLTKRSLINSIKNELIETKQKIIIGNTVGLTHNTIYTINPLGNIPIGTGSASRIGQTINVKSVRMTFELNNGSSGNAFCPTYFRVLCLKSRGQFQQSVDTLASGLGSTDIFEAGSSNLLYSRVDFNKVNLLSDKVIKCVPTNTTGTLTIDSHLVPCDEIALGKMDYLTPTSNYGKTMNLYVVVIGFYPGGVSGVSVTGNATYEGVVTFTDTK